MENKIFNDPIHNHMELPGLCITIIDTPEFQRLRYIKKLGGCYFVYPGAAHNRFEHSLGVCFLAGKLAKTLKYRQPELNIDDKDILCIQIAGLCKDLGHGPFSYVFERKFIPAVRNEEWKHEDASVKMFEHLIEQNHLETDFKKFGLNETDVIFIKEQIVGSPVNSKNEKSIDTDWLYRGRSQSKGFLYEIVANRRNGIEVNKWDSIARDCHHLDIQSVFDHNRFLKFARVIKDDDGDVQICSRDKEIQNLYDMFYFRYLLSRRAYQHKTTTIVEHMLAEALISANNHIKFSGKGGLKRKMSECVDDMFAYTKLNDSVFHKILHSTDDNLKPAREILRNIEGRKLYKFVHKVSQDELNDGPTKELLNRTDVEIASEFASFMQNKMIDSPDDPETRESDRRQRLEESDIFIQVVEFDYGMKHENPVDRAKFFRKSDPDKAIKITRDEVSVMLPVKFYEKIVRLYSKKNLNQNTFNFVYKCFEEFFGLLPILQKDDHSKY